MRQLAVDNRHAWMYSGYHSEECFELMNRTKGWYASSDSDRDEVFMHCLLLMVVRGGYAPWHHK